MSEVNPPNLSNDPSAKVEPNNFVSKDEVRSLLLLKRDSLLKIGGYRKMIEDYGKGKIDQLPEKLMRGMACLIAGDFHLFVEGTIDGATTVPPGSIDVTDEKRQWLAIEIYCRDEDLTRRKLADYLKSLMEDHTDRHYYDMLRLLNMPIREGLHLNQLHRVAGVIEYPESKKENHERPPNTDE